MDKQIIVYSNNGIWIKNKNEWAINNYNTSESQKRYVEQNKADQKIHARRNSLVVQWLRLQASTAGGPGSIPGWGAKILQAAHTAKKTNKNHTIWFHLYEVQNKEN